VLKRKILWREVMSKSNVVSFTEKKAELQAGVGFLELLDDDIKANPDSVQPLSRGLVQRIETLRAKADANRRRELQEG
jgi:antitoxin PrlF